MVFAIALISVPCSFASLFVRIIAWGSMSSAKRSLYSGLPPMDTKVRWYSHDILQVDVIQRSAFANAHCRREELSHMVVNEYWAPGVFTQPFHGLNETFFLYWMSTALRAKSFLEVSEIMVEIVVVLQMLFDQDWTVEHLFNYVAVCSSAIRSYSVSARRFWITFIINFHGGLVRLIDLLAVAFFGEGITGDWIHYS